MGDFRLLKAISSRTFPASRRYRSVGPFIQFFSPLPLSIVLVFYMALSRGHFYHPFRSSFIQFHPVLALSVYLPFLAYFPSYFSLRVFVLHRLRLTTRLFLFSRETWTYLHQYALDNFKITGRDSSWRNKSKRKSDIFSFRASFRRYENLNIGRVNSRLNARLSDEFWAPIFSETGP